MTLHRVSPGADGPPPVASGYVFGTPAVVLEGILDDTFTTGTALTGRVPDAVGTGTWVITDPESSLRVTGGVMLNSQPSGFEVAYGDAFALYALPAEYTTWRCEAWFAAPVEEEGPQVNGGNGVHVATIGVFPDAEGLGTPVTADWMFWPSAVGGSRMRVNETDDVPFVTPLAIWSTATVLRFSMDGTPTGTTYTVDASDDGVTFSTLGSTTGAASVAASVAWSLPSGPGTFANRVNTAQITRILFSATA